MALSCIGERMTLARTVPPPHPGTRHFLVRRRGGDAGARANNRKAIGRAARGARQTTKRRGPLIGRRVVLRSTTTAREVPPRPVKAMVLTRVVLALFAWAAALITSGRTSS